MDSLTLLAEAEAIGLDVRADGDRLVVRGPRSAESLARRLLARKPEVLSALRGEGDGLSPAATVQSCNPTIVAAPAPTAACHTGGFRLWWRRPVDGGWVCGLCHPDPEALAGERSRPGPAVGEGGR